MITQEVIDEVLDNFDFEKVEKVMNAIHWRWAMSEEPDGIPTIAEMRKTARKLLKDLSVYKKEENINQTGTGGFYAEIIDNEVVQLRFEVTSVEVGLK